MKKQLTKATIAAISMFYAVCLFSCSSEPRVTSDDNIKLAFSKGYITGANAAMDMIGNGTYSPEALKNKWMVDSVAFARLIDSVDGK